MFQKMTEKVQSMAMRKKLYLIVIISIGILSISVLFSFFLLMNAYNKLLYKTVADSLSSSAAKISDELENINAVSTSMISDKSLQQMLGQVTDDPHSVSTTLNFSIYNTLETYFQQFRYNHLSYLILDNNSLLTEPYMHTYIRSSQKFPDPVYRNLLKSAQGHQGRAVWVTEYSSSYGLFLVREIRRIQDVKLDTLGTLIINVDTSSLLENSSHYSSQFGKASYLLTEGSDMIGASEKLTADDIRMIQEKLSAAYGMISLSQGKYFVVKNKIPFFEWDFYSLIPYNSVFNSLLAAQILFFTALAASLAAAIFLSRYFIRTLMVHLDRLIHKIRLFGENDGTLPDTFQTCSYAKRNDEFGILHQNFDNMADQIHHLIHVNYQNELLMKDAQIKALETQINPHFLYNTLESINWRAKDLGEQDISRMVESLGYLLRAALSQKSKTFSIRQELEFVNCYLTIQKIRFADQLRIGIEADENLMDIQIPKLIIQPLAENAIHNALEEIMDECYIQINIFRENHLIYIEVKNSGSQFEENLLNKLKDERIKPNGFGIGLLNINERLKLTFGNEYGLTLYNQDNLAAASIRLPYPEDKGGVF